MGILSSREKKLFEVKRRRLMTNSKFQIEKSVRWKGKVLRTRLQGRLSLKRGENLDIDKERTLELLKKGGNVRGPGHKCKKVI